MTSVPLSPNRHAAQTDRLATQIGLARELALSGAPGPARQVCGAVFVEHAPVLMRDRALLGAYVECLLLLEMTALLPRVLQAFFGVAFDMSRLTGQGPRRWLLQFGNGVTMAMPASAPRADRATRALDVARWSPAILAAAAREPAGLAAAEREPELAF